METEDPVNKVALIGIQFRLMSMIEPGDITRQTYVALISNNIGDIEKEEAGLIFDQFVPNDSAQAPFEQIVLTLSQVYKAI